MSFATILLLSYIWGWQDSFPGDRLVVLGLYVAAGVLGQRARAEDLREVGFGGQGLGSALAGLAPFVFSTGGAAVVLGAAAGSLHPPRVAHLPVVLLVGMAWGVAQEYGLVVIFYRGLREIAGERWARLVAPILFAILHLPNPLLTALTLIAGWVACTVYRRAPNLWALGIAHGVLSLAVSRSLPMAWTAGMRVGPGFLRFTG